MVDPVVGLGSEQGAEPFQLVVVGAGAAGLWAAARAAELGVHVLLLEKTPRPGSKVLASGGTRCNLTTSLPVEDALATFGEKGKRFLRRAFRALPPLDVRARFEELGVPTHEEEWDKVFPTSGRARDVRDALVTWGRAAGVELRTEASVQRVVPREGGLDLVLEDGEVCSARNVFLCPGGKSYPRTGTVGDGYRWLEELGLPLVEPVPALAPLRCPDEGVRELSGIALQNVVVQLQKGSGKRLGRRERPLLFTHTGLSGPAAMDLSEPVARAEAQARRSGQTIETLQLVVDLLPDIEREDLRTELIDAGARRGAPSLERCIAQGLSTPLPRKLVRTLLLPMGLGDRRAGEISKSERHTLVETLKGWALPVDGTLGFDKAEVTAGGLALSSVDPGTMRVRGIDGLWVFGELLDLTGPIGGLNFQAAFATAELAARSVAGNSDPAP